MKELVASVVILFLVAAGLLGGMVTGGNTVFALAMGTAWSLVASVLMVIGLMKRD